MFPPIYINVLSVVLAFAWIKNNVDICCWNFRNYIYCIICP